MQSYNLSIHTYVYITSIYGGLSDLLSVCVCVCVFVCACVCARDTTRNQFFDVHAFCAFTLVSYRDHISSDPLSVPRLMVDTVTYSAVEYQVHHRVANILITGYEVTCFGVPMIGEYVNTGRGRRVTISPAVPGAQYRITAWALSDGRRSVTPAVVDVTTGEASET